MMFAIILSSLALLAATISAILVLVERKRSQKRNAALLQDMDSKITEATQSLARRIKALEGGIVPDFEKAKEAANAVNDFNAGITGILGFDPYEALQAQREQYHGGKKA